MLNTDNKPEPSKAVGGPSLRSSVKWTLLGYVAYGACQWLMLVIVARMGLPEMVGQFALATAITTPIILLIGIDLRTVQATDQSQRYRFEDFLLLRAISLVIAQTVIVGCTFWSGYTWETKLLIWVMGLAKCVEAISEVCYGSLQQYERFDQMAIARILRGVASIAVLAAGLFLFRSLLLATVAMAASWAAVLVFYDWPLVSRLLSQHGLSSGSMKFRLSSVWHLLPAALPAGILSCQASLEQSLPRLCIDRYMNDRELGLFSAVSSVIFAANMIVNSAHVTCVPRVAKLMVADQWRAAWSILIKLSLFGVCVGGLGTAVAWIAGEWFLGLAFGSEYARQSGLLVVLMFGAALRFATLPLATGLRAAQRFWSLVVLQSLSLVGATPIMMLLVEQHGGIGAAYGSLVLVGLLTIIQLPASWWYLNANAGSRSSTEAIEPTAPGRIAA